MISRTNDTANTIAAFVERVLTEKQWDSANDLIAYVLLHVEAELKLDDTADLTGLRNEVQIGIEQADRGELTDGPAIVNRLRGKLEAARKHVT